MPKKDTANAVLGMLSTAGAQTRAAEAAAATTSDEKPEPAPELTTASRVVDVQPTASVSSLPPARAKSTAADAPRTVRLSQAAAQQLREAWLEAKRDDVLLTAQDFASALVEDALNRRRRSRAASSR